MWIVEKTKMRSVFYQHHVASWVSYDPRNLDQVDYCIWEEDQVHAGPSQDLVVLRRFSELIILSYVFNVYGTIHNSIQLANKKLAKEAHLF